jgi:hypothetical protein
VQTPTNDGSLSFVDRWDGDRGQRPGLHVEEPRIVSDPLPIRLQGLEVLEISKVMREERLPALREAKRTLEFASACEDRATRGPGERQGLRAIAPRTPHQNLLFAKDAHHAVIGPDMNRTVVSQEEVCHGRQAFERRWIGILDGLFGDVPTRQHKRIGVALAEKVMHGCVGQQETDETIPRRHRIGERGSSLPSHEYDGALGARQASLLGPAEFRELVPAREVATMTAKGL